MPKQLTTQNASITTVAVEVKALTISGKQVTLSVFRQLQYEQLIAPDGTLNGVPWGFVNYHPDKCDDYRHPHWHIIWQLGGELRRTRVDHVPDFDPQDGVSRAPRAFESTAVNRLLTSSVLEWLSGRRPDCPLHKDQHSTKYSDEITYKTPHNFSAWGYAHGLAVAAANAHHELARAMEWVEGLEGYLPEADPEWRERERQRRLERLDSAQAAHDAACAELAAQVATWGRTHDEVIADFKAACNQEATRRKRHRDVRATLAQLPQLFIAV